MVQTADGALEEVHDMLQRMNELCVQAANGTNAASDRQKIQDELSQLVTDFDGNDWVNGAGAALHIGADADMNNKLIVYIDAMDAESLGVSKVDVTTEDSATISIERVSLAIAQVSALGAYQNRLEHTIKNLDNVVENTTAAESQIRDTDMAKEMTAYANVSILQQAAQSMLAQANQSNQGVLSLIA